MRHFITPVLAGTALLAAIVAPRLAASLQPAPVGDADPVPTDTAPPSVADLDPTQPLLQVRLDRDTALAGGLVRAELTVVAPTVDTDTQSLPTDVVLVIDRSGSMGGDKMEDAKQAAHSLVNLLGTDDRVAVVSFSDGARIDSPLAEGDWKTVGAIRALSAAGGTEMQAGLQQAISLVAEPTPGRARRVILLSDGQPNTRGGLPELAHRAAQLESPLTTVGIGADYDVELMQQLADAGTGNFYWARKDMPLASVFANEFDATRAAVTSRTTLAWTAPTGVEVVDWGGLSSQGNQVELGQLFSGQRRSHWVTLRIDGSVDAEEVLLGGMKLSWSSAADGATGAMVADLGTVEVTHDQQVAMAGLDHSAWAASVVEEEYNQVLGDVQSKLSRGDKAGALQDLKSYRQRNERLNAHVKSAAVVDNLAEVDALEQQVQHDQMKKTGLLDLANQAWSGRRKGQVYRPSPRP